MIATVEGALAERTWLAGAGFTGADLYVASALRYGMLFGIVPKEGVIADYVARCTDRPAFHRMSELDERFIREQEAAGS